MSGLIRPTKHIIFREKMTQLSAGEVCRDAKTHPGAIARVPPRRRRPARHHLHSLCESHAAWAKLPLSRRRRTVTLTEAFLFFIYVIFGKINGNPYVLRRIFNCAAFGPAVMLVLMLDADAVAYLRRLPRYASNRGLERLACASKLLCGARRSCWRENAHVGSSASNSWSCNCVIMFFF